MDAFRGIAKVYADNISRVVALARFAPDSIFYASLSNRAMEWSDKITGNPQEDASRNGPDAVRKYMERVESVVSFMDTRPLGEVNGNIFKMGATWIDSADTLTLESWGTSLSNGIESVFYAMILNSYAAFEAPACDLWIEAVNQDYTLAATLIKGTHRRGETNSQRKNDSEEDERLELRSIALGDLLQNEFDLRNNMGTFLRNKKAVSFGSLVSMQKAYRDAFGPEAEAIFSSNPRLPLVAKTRHLIAHRSGVIDKDYLRTVIETKWPNFGNETDGQYLSVNGPIVSEMIQISIDAAVALVKYVDGRGVNARQETNEDKSEGP